MSRVPSIFDVNRATDTDPEAGVSRVTYEKPFAGLDTVPIGHVRGRVSVHLSLLFASLLLGWEHKLPCL